MKFDAVKNQGYWSVQDQQFNNKVKAILFAQQNGLDVTDIKYHYNDFWWDQHDWSIEPQESLDEIYVRRAKQLRNKYKTLILRYSGGSDSHNILKTFVDNNIKIDVISVNMWTLGDPDNTINPINIEKELFAFPYLREVQSQGADFKVIVSDQSGLMSIIGDDPNWFLKFDTPRFSLIDLSAHRSCTTAEYKEFDNPDTCVIAGIDKPQLRVLHDKIWYFEIYDYLHTMINKNETHMVQEPFYWTADMPEIPIKQSHVVKKFFQSHLNHLRPGEDSKLKLMIQNKAKLIPIIYPNVYGHLDPLADKLPYYDHGEDSVAWRTQRGLGSQSPRSGQTDRLMHLSPYYDTWVKGVELANSMIDRRFKIGETIMQDGLITIGSKKRWLGK